MPGEKATADTQYFTGSTTKAFVAAAIAQLVHNTSHFPDISWTSPISQFIRSDFVLEDGHPTTHTTIEDALSHRTGLPRHDLIYGVAGDTPAAIVERLRYLPMTAEPRTMFQYCNLMYVVMTEFLEAVTGVELETLLQEQFWGPLGMLSTSFTLSKVRSESKLARGYFWDSSTKKGRYIPEPYLDLLPISGAGATISTVNDYALWIKALLSAANPHGKANHSSPITAAMFHDLVRPRTIVSTDFYDSEDPWAFVNPALYALGWLTIKAGGETIIAHNGGLTGFGTNVYLLPEHRFGIAMMGNTADTSNEAEGVLATVLLKRKLGIARGLSEGEAESVDLKNLEETLRSVSHVTLSKGNRQRPSRATQSQHEALHATSLPLPGAIEDYAGLYSHPAYGVFNFTVINSPESSAAPTKLLRAILAPRTWPIKLELRHTTDTLFALWAFQPHGLGDIYSEDIFWEEGEGTSRAIFKFGLDGETVETLAIELEESMVEMARAKGPKFWKEGMIWFEKV